MVSKTRTVIEGFTYAWFFCLYYEDKYTFQSRDVERFSAEWDI